MEEIDVSQLLNYFKSKIIYVLLAMSITFCLSSIYVNRFRVPEYTNSTTILLNQANENTSINYNDVNLNKQLVSTYGEIIKSKRVLGQVIESLELDLEYKELSSRVAVGEITDTSIIRISVTDTDSELAAEIANMIADVFSKEIVEIYKIENVSIIDSAEASEIPSSASTMKIIGISTIAGAFISLAVIFILFYFDTTIKNEEDIEKATGLPVIGIVPISREKIKYSAHRKYYDDLAKKHRSQEVLPVQKEVRKMEVTNEINTEKEIGIQKKIEEPVIPIIEDEIKEEVIPLETEVKEEKQEKEIPIEKPAPKKTTTKEVKEEKKYKVQNSKKRKRTTNYSTSNKTNYNKTKGKSKV